MGKKVFKCDTRGCERLFSSKFSLKRHNLTHLGQKNHICKHCNKAFVLPQYLEEHEYTHTGAKPFICGINGC
jgi:KRAB domain-containing zinc finger protein